MRRQIDKGCSLRQRVVFYQFKDEFRQLEGHFYKSVQGYGKGTGRRLPRDLLIRNMGFKVKVGYLRCLWATI
jgi:hypothetical protein